MPIVTLLMHFLQRKHPDLFEHEKGWKEEWFDPRMLRALMTDTREAWDEVVTPKVDGLVFSVPMFTDRFCEMLIEEVDAFAASGLPARRPNSMNRYGLVLNSIGMKVCPEMCSSQQAMSFLSVGVLFLNSFLNSGSMPGGFMNSVCRC